MFWGLYSKGDCRCHKRSFCWKSRAWNVLVWHSLMAAVRRRSCYKDDTFDGCFTVDGRVRCWSVSCAEGTKSCSILFNSASCTLFILVQLKRALMCADWLILSLSRTGTRKYTVLPPTAWGNFSKSFYTPVHNAFKQSIWHQNPKSEMLNISSRFVAKIQHWTLARPVRTKAVFMAASNICG